MHRNLRLVSLHQGRTVSKSTNVGNQTVNKDSPVCRSHVTGDLKQLHAAIGSTIWHGKEVLCRRNYHLRRRRGQMCLKMSHRLLSKRLCHSRVLQVVNRISLGCSFCLVRHGKSPVKDYFRQQTNGTCSNGGGHALDWHCSLRTCPLGLHRGGPDISVSFAAWM